MQTGSSVIVMDRNQQHCGVAVKWRSQTGWHSGQVSTAQQAPRPLDIVGHFVSTPWQLRRIKGSESSGLGREAGLSCHFARFV